jgi:inorganic triphosphatase YgiF
MGTEIELKLIIENENVDAFFHLPLIDEFALGACKEKRLFSQYYDTGDYLLWAHGTALRVRQEGDVFVQTLKRKGKSVQGLSERKEWEWQLKDSILDSSLVPFNLWPSSIQSRLSELQPIFNTEFKRSLLMLYLPEGCLAKGQQAATVEMVLDQGKIEAKTDIGLKTEPILEVELELKQGVSEDLFHLSKKIAEDLPISPSNVSKAERGYGLLGVERHS